MILLVQYNCQKYPVDLVENELEQKDAIVKVMYQSGFFLRSQSQVVLCDISQQTYSSLHLLTKEGFLILIKLMLFYNNFE